MSASLDIRESPHFPKFSHLPYDNDYKVRYYQEYSEGSIRPQMHWVFLAQITKNQTMDLSKFNIGGPRRGGRLGIERPRYLARDRSGMEIHVAFHLDEEEMSLFDARKYQVGHTLVVYYANSHGFGDGSMGLRLETLSNVKVIPCSLEELVEASTSIASEVQIESAMTCTVCGTALASVRRCAGCKKVAYCSKDCQKRDWKDHKPRCVAVSQINEWKSKDWNNFREFWTA